VILLVVAEAVTSQLTSSTGGHSVRFMVMISLLAGLAGVLVGFTVLLKKMKQDMTTLNDFVAVSAFALFTFNIGLPGTEFNSAFIDFLQTNGFYLANGSRANYVPTFQSLASTRNMDYLDKLLEPFNRNSNNR
jgi:hypothetical protein